MLSEYHRANSAKGRLTPDLSRAFMILSEEYGELTKAIVDYTRIPTATVSSPAGDLDQVLTEAVQLASVAISIIENIAEGRVTTNHDFHA